MRNIIEAEQIVEDIVEDIEREMTELYPKKELAYMDYLDNSGDNSGLRERLWCEFEQYQDIWNKLVKHRKEVLKRIN